MRRVSLSSGGKKPLRKTAFYWKRERHCPCVVLIMKKGLRAFINW